MADTNLFSNRIVPPESELPQSEAKEQSHLTLEEVFDYLSQRFELPADSAVRNRIYSHIADCSKCRALLVSAHQTETQVEWQMVPEATQEEKARALALILNDNRRAGSLPSEFLGSKDTPDSLITGNSSGPPTEAKSDKQMGQTERVIEKAPEEPVWKPTSEVPFKRRTGSTSGSRRNQLFPLRAPILAGASLGIAVLAVIVISNRWPKPITPVGSNGGIRSTSHPKSETEKQIERDVLEIQPLNTLRPPSTLASPSHEGDGPEPVRPFNTCVLPGFTLQARPMQEATRYRVEVYPLSKAGTLNTVLATDDLVSPEYTLPKSSNLARGQWYGWRMSAATKDSKPQHGATAAFLILPIEEEQKVKELITTDAKRTANGNEREHQLFKIKVYLTYGLLDEAREALALYLREPGINQQFALALQEHIRSIQSEWNQELS